MYDFLTLGLFMVDKLNLHGKELIAYAIIYAATQSGPDVSVFDENTERIEKWCNVSPTEAQKLIDKLVKKNLVIKDKAEWLGILDETVYYVNLKMLE